MRVGNEKSEEEADTVGTCSLRVEHVFFPSENVIKLDFLGKDSMRYENTVTVMPKVYRNLKEFTRGKAGSSNIFDQINVIYSHYL